jgi:hypothetical protein
MSGPSPDHYCDFCDVCYYTITEHLTDLACARYQKHEADQLSIEVAAYRKEFITEGERTGLEYNNKLMEVALNRISAQSKCGIAVTTAVAALFAIQGEKTEGG